MDTQLKKCCRCRQLLPATSEYFWKDNTHKDGFRSSCRECTNKPRESFIQKDRKRCCRCDRYLPATEEFFYKNKSKPDGFRHECKDCDRQYIIDRKEIIQAQRKAFQVRHKERLSKERREKYKKDSSLQLKLKEINYTLKYNISLEEVAEMMDEQKGCCAICKESLVNPEDKKSFKVDHDHNTGKVRGLLCNMCNLLLGHAYDNIETLKSAITYLENSNE